MLSWISRLYWLLNLKTMDDLIKKYDELYDDMATAKDPKKMMIFGSAEKSMFHALAEKHPEIAKMWLTKLEAGKWHNYLSEEEAEEIVESLVEKQGEMEVKRYEWDYDTLRSAVEAMGGKVSDAPYYNCWSMWATMNMLHSDHANTVNMFIQPNLRAKFYYHLAVDKLKDVDRPHFVREYFHLVP